MGISDPYYFAWLREALGRFEAESQCLAAMRKDGRPLGLWVLAGRRMNSPVDFVVNALGRENTTVRFLDKFAHLPDVSPVDFNALDDIPGNSCDVLLMTRASYMVEGPGSFLLNARRIIRPGGLMIVDWLHGFSDAPVLHLPGHHEYDGRVCPFLTTYCDPTFLSEFSGEFEAFLRHVNRPPWWVNLKAPGTRAPLRERVKRLLGRGPRRNVTIGNFLETMGAELERAGKHLIEPDLLEQSFKVAFRDARYFYPWVKRFNLHLLTVLRPVGK